MKKIYLVLILTVFMLDIADNAIAQIVGPNVFLQGAYLEIGMETNGAFGATTSPVGYHPHLGGATWTTGSPLAEVYDYGHDGWSVGAPPFMGDYTYPGSPFEGWEIQYNGLAQTQGYEFGGGAYTFSGGGTMTGGGITGYSNTGGQLDAYWAGTVAGGSLAMKSDTRVDTFGSAVTVTVTFKNVGATPVTSIYYWRSCDPDNDVSWPGGSFSTNNVINFQTTTIPNPEHKVMVTATGMSPTTPPLTLCTKDCRAVAVIYNAWPLSIGTDLSTLWNQTYGGAFYNVGVNHPGDIAIGIVWNLGTLPPGDSLVVSYAYVFDGISGIDSVGALPDPALDVNGAIAYSPGPPLPIIDTYNACLNPLLTSVPVNILYADRAWSFTNWTWTPALGLASTTGTTNFINVTVLPNVETYTITGTDSATCNTWTMYLTVLTCNTVRVNSPCAGDTLKFRYTADSTGATFFWYKAGGGFTSTLEDPFKFPATYADSGEYYVVRTISGIHDTDSTHVTIEYKPVITATNNAPLCQGMVDTLLLYASPDTLGETWSWTGPAGFTSTLENPTRPGYISIDTGVYRVITATPFGCKDTAYTDAGIIPQPLPPVVSGPVKYCQGATFVDWTVTGLVPGGRILWYPNNTVPIGDTLAIPPSVNTALPGVTTVYFSQRAGACESLRDSFKVRVVTTPSVPTAAGPMQYCQFIGTVDTLTVSPTADSVNWYFAATGGVPFISTPGHNNEPLPIISLAGIYNYWISRTDSGCESARNPVTITIHPKPNKPIITPTPICQFLTPIPLIASPDTTGVGTALVAPTPLLWYGPGVTTGTAITPVPQTTVAPDTVTYYVTETTIYGCVSDSAIDVNVIKVKPPVPVTKNTAYCQFAPVHLMNDLVDSIGNSHLNWYYNSIPTNALPFTDTIPGTYKWYVSQTVPNNAAGCESDSAAVNVTVIYKPVFGINVSNTYVCEFDSLRLSYYGPQLFTPSYTWALPAGAIAAARTNIYDSSIVIEFDTANQNQYVYLTVTDDSGFCSTTDTVLINVVKQPYMAGFSQPDVCLGDTVQLALEAASSGAYAFTWYIDKVLMASSTAINIITSNSNSGGPYEIRWIDTGLHVISVTSVSKEGCKSMPAYDSVNVHQHPDPSFLAFAKDSTVFCLQDSAKFVAKNINYNYSYAWSPSNYFQNINSPVIWGTMDNAESIVTLKVTDPYGCYATSSQTFYPQTCCTVIFPNAFTPGGTINKTFEPIMQGYHMFHEFKIVNRWGVMVFEGGNSTLRWDGNYNGVPQDMGTYFYYLKYDCGGKTIEAKGDVTLIR